MDVHKKMMRILKIPKDIKVLGLLAKQSAREELVLTLTSCKIRNLCLLAVTKADTNHSLNLSTIFKYMLGVLKFIFWLVWYSKIHRLWKEFYRDSIFLSQKEPLYLVSYQTLDIIAHCNTVKAKGLPIFSIDPYYIFLTR